MRAWLCLLTLALCAAARARAQEVVFASADASSGDDLVIVSSIDDVRAPQNRKAEPRKQTATEPLRRHAAVQHLGRISDLSEDDEEEDDNGPTPLIVGGKRVPARLRRHLARVIIVQKDNSLISCTGSVIAPTYVLSAAHCFVDEGPIDVQASYVLIAEKSTKTKFFRSPRNKVFMKNVFVHRRYRNDGTFANDLALVELEEEIDERLYSAIPLERPPKEDDTRLKAAGYGVKGSEESQPKRVRQADVLYQSWATCDAQLGFFGANDRGKEFCYTSLGFPDRGRTGTCFGDSGGPIVQRVDGVFEQVGITSYFYGDLCESAGAVMVAMNVRRYRKLIRRKVRRNRNRGWRRIE